MITNDIIVISKTEIQVVFRVPAEDITKFDTKADKRRLSRSALLRECVLKEIEENE